MQAKVEIVRKHFVNKETEEQVRYYEYVVELDGQRINLKPAEQKRGLANYILDKIYKD